MNSLTRSLVTLGALAAIAGAIGFYAYRSTDVDVVAKKKKAAAKAAALLKFDADAVEKIEITKLGNKALLVKRPDSWWVEEPAKIQASASTVRTVLNNLVQLKAEAAFDGPGEPEAPADSETGLDAPDSKVRIWLKGESEPAFTIDVGDDNAFDGSVFAKVEQGSGAKTYAVSKALRTIILKGASEFFDRRVFGDDTAAFVGLKVEPRVQTDAQVAYTLIRHIASDVESSYAAQKAQWELAEPSKGMADADVTRAILESLSAAPAQEFLTITKAKDLSQYGLNDPDWVVTAFIRPKGYEGERPVKRVVRISSVRQMANGLAVNVTRDDQPWVARTSAVLTGGLARSAEELRTKRLFSFDVDEIERVEMHLKAGVGDITVERKSERGQREVAWMILSPEPGLAMSHKVLQLLLTWVHIVGAERAEDLSGDPAKDAAVLEKTGLGKSAQTMTFLDKDGKKLGVLRIGKIDGEMLYVKSDQSPFIIKVPKTKLTEVPGSVEDLTRR